MACFLLLCCHHEKVELEPIPEEPEPDAPYVMPCGCEEEWYQEEIIWVKDLPWDYPVKPGTEEWNQLSLKHIDERVNVCQIPEDILSTLSTEDLTELCMQYPLLSQILFVYNTYEGGLNTLFSHFNGIRELFQRNDGVKELLRKYRYIIQNSPDTTGDFDIQNIRALEVILARYQSPDDSKENYMEIVQYLVCGYKKNLMNPEILLQVTNFYARAVILAKIDEQKLESIPRKGSNHVFQLGYLDEQTERAINELSCQYINH